MLLVYTNYAGSVTNYSVSVLELRWQCTLIMLVVCANYSLNVQ